MTQAWFSQGTDTHWMVATLAGGVPLTLSDDKLGGGTDEVFPAGGVTPPPPVDTTPPVLATPIALTVVAGSTAPLALSATDPDNTAAQITYTETAAPAHGTIEDGGVTATRWTQADLAAGRVTYVETGTAATTDSIGFAVSDPAGNSVSGTLPITVTAPARGAPGAIKLAPGVMLIPHSDGTWNWK